MLGVDVVWMKYSVCLPKSCLFTSLRACISLYFCVSDASLAAQAPLAFRFCDTIGHMFLCIFVCFCIFCVYLCSSVSFCVNVCLLECQCHVRCFSSRASSTCILLLWHNRALFDVFLCISMCFSVFLCISVCFCVFSREPLSYQMLL